MSHLRIAAALFLVLGACSTAGEATNTLTTATLQGGTVFTNGAIYTVNSDDPWAEALAIRDGVIVAVGAEAAVLDAVGGSAEIIDLDGRMVVPGFHDLHVHVPEAGINAGLCFVPFGETLAVYGDLIFDCATEQPGSGWVRAAGASVADLVGGADKPIDVLDAAVPDRPLLVLDNLGHSVMANSAALAAAGISTETADPDGGIIGRDATTGRLDGVFAEDAQHLIRDAAAVGADVVYDGLPVALAELAENGVTSVSDAGGYWTRGHTDAWLQAEADGYDAVCIDTVSDSGVAALRSILDIPVIAPGRTMFLTALMLGRRFGVLSMWERWFGLYERTLRELGIEDRCAGIRSIDTQPDSRNLFSGKEDDILPALHEAALRLIQDDGADVICLGSTTMHQAHEYLQERLPVPVLNPGPLSYLTAETTLALGLTQSRKAYPRPLVSKTEMIAEMLSAAARSELAEGRT